jgi:hypothetical protein
MSEAQHVTNLPSMRGRDTRDTRNTRTPRRPHRMLDAYALPSPALEPARSGRASLRVAVPDRLLCMTRFGLECAFEGPSGWWKQVENAMQALVDAHLPARACDLEMSLDAERLEVVLTYRLSQPKECVRSEGQAPLCA